MLKTKNLHTLYRDLFQVIDSPNESTAVLCRIAVLCRSQRGISLKGNPRAKKGRMLRNLSWTGQNFIFSAGAAQFPTFNIALESKSLFR
jgi:hypothetical protein